jgi:DNA-binding MarR family transcriptional regulator
MLAMEARYARESRKAGLTSQQARLLCAAARRQAALGEIAGILRCGRSNVSRLPDRVTARGLAYRGHPGRDGRVAVIKLTEDGRALVSRFECDLERRLSALVTDQPAEHAGRAADALTSLIHAIFADIDAQDETPGLRTPHTEPAAS